MKKQQLAGLVAGGMMALPWGLVTAQEREQWFTRRPAVQTAAQPSELTVEHAECTFFGAKRDRFVGEALQRSGQVGIAESGLSALTGQVASALVPAPGGSRTRSFQGTHQAGSIDSYIYADLQANGVQPADKTTDYEFIRRVTLDLTGRIPAPSRVLSFVSDSAPDKRTTLIDELLAKPEWVDKWTMYFGDLYKNNQNMTQVRRYAEGRNAFYKWIHDSVANEKPYNQMATELIAAQGNNGFDMSQGNINFLVGGIVTGGPGGTTGGQDIFDQQAANIAETFLGITHMNCVLCHNGRGHLDSLSLWGSTTTRYEAWQFASFLSRTWTQAIQTPTDPNNPNSREQYYSLNNNYYPKDYNLNTTTGNRPARQPVGTEKNVKPAYFFTGQTPSPGEDYRAALARFITNDPQFARAAVNYIWAQFFERGIVDPPDQFDPARLDPDNLPPAPWTLQPSNARLLNALAQHFIDSGYNLKSLMREITNSDTYQLSTRYNGTWDPNNEKYFARKFVRRLWAEEVHDAVAQATNLIPSYTVPGFTNDSTVYGVTSPGFGKISWAMQLPEVVGLPGGTVTNFLDSFMRGNRDDNPRRSEGSILQALNMMNDSFVESRIHANVQGGLLAANLKLHDDQLIAALYLNVLSRYPSDEEKAAASAKLATGNRSQAAEDLLWTLLNKVDFLFNY